MSTTSTTPVQYTSSENTVSSVYDSASSAAVLDEWLPIVSTTGTYILNPTKAYNMNAYIAYYDAYSEAMTALLDSDLSTTDPEMYDTLNTFNNNINTYLSGTTLYATDPDTTNATPSSAGYVNVYEADGTTPATLAYVVTMSSDEDLISSYDLEQEGKTPPNNLVYSNTQAKDNSGSDSTGTPTTWGDYNCNTSKDKYAENDYSTFYLVTSSAGNTAEQSAATTLSGL